MKSRYRITATCFDRKGRKISIGENSYKRSHPTQKFFAERAGEPYKECLHAEIHALIRAGKKEVDTLVVMRFNAHGKFANAKPCKTCEEAIKFYKVKKVIYSTNEGMKEQYYEYL